MANQLNLAAVHHLKPGRVVFYKAGTGKHRVEAIATVARQVPYGAKEVEISIFQINHKGADVRDCREGVVISAGVSDLYLP